MIAIVDYGRGNLGSVEKALRAPRHARPRHRGPACGRRTRRRWCCPATGPFDDVMGSLAAPGPDRPAARLLDERPPVLRDLPRLSAPVLGERGVRPGQGARRHPGGGAALPGRAQGAAHGLEPRRAPAATSRSSTGFRAAPTSTSCTPTTRRPRRRVAPGGDLRPTGPFPAAVERGRPVRDAVPPREEPALGASACSRTSPPSCEAGGADMAFTLIPAVDLKGGPLRAPAAGPGRRRDRLLRRPGGDGAALAGARGARGCTWSISTGPSRAGPPRPTLVRADHRRGAHPGAGGRRACATLAAVEAVLEAGARWAVRGHARRAGPGVPRRGVRRPSRAGHRRQSTLRRQRGGGRLDARAAIWTRSPWRATRAAAGAAARALHRHRARRHRRAAPTSGARRRWPRRPASPSSPPAASARSTTSGSSRRCPAWTGVIVGRALYSGRGGPAGARARRGAAEPHARQAHHPLPRRQGRARGQGRALRRAARRGRSGGGRAGLRRPGRRRAGVPRHHRLARGPRRPCSTWCAAPPRASTCRSPSAAASARSTTSAPCCAPAPTRSRSTPRRWRGRRSITRGRASASAASASSSPSTPSAKAGAKPARWGVYTHGGRRPAGRDAVAWAREVERARARARSCSPAWTATAPATATTSR